MVVMFFHIVTKSGEDLFRAGTIVDFGVVEGIATERFYNYSRNPIYTAGIFLLIPATMLLSNTLYTPLLHLVTIAYLRYVISVEETFLSPMPGYSDYVNTTGRFIPDECLMVVAGFFLLHELEFIFKVPLYLSRPDTGGLGYHFVMTLLWGVVWWKPIIKGGGIDYTTKKKKEE